MNDRDRIYRPGDSLLEYWQRGVVGESVPGRDYFDPLALRPWIGCLSVYEAIDGGADFRNRLEGTRVMELTGENWQGRLASEVDSRFNVTFLSDLRQVAEDRVPLRQECVVFQKQYFHVDRILLPVSVGQDDASASAGAGAGGGDVEQVFLAMFRIREGRARRG